jgi:hypothetical protein
MAGSFGLADVLFSCQGSFLQSNAKWYQVIRAGALCFSMTISQKKL